MLVMLSVASPLLVSVTSCAGLVDPVFCDPNARLDADSVTTGAVGGVVPLPLRATLCGLPAAVSVKLSDAVRVPAAVGLKATATLQLALTASGPVQPSAVIA